MTPTQRTLKWLRDRGYVAAVVEKWIERSKQRIDLFGFADVIAYKPNDPGVLLVQCFSTAWSEHVQKITGERLEEVKSWIGDGEKSRRLMLMGWRKLKEKRGGKKMVYRPRIAYVAAYRDRVAIWEDDWE